MRKSDVTYKEPKGYFNADMLKAAREWEKQNAQKTKKANSTNNKGKK